MTTSYFEKASASRSLRCPKATLEPPTTKADEHYHGFGMRSIQLIAESYKENVAVLVADGVFNLNITIPIPNEVS